MNAGCFFANQIQVLEELFMQCPRPTDTLCVTLAEKLGLEPRDVMIWFDTKRVLKTQKVHEENLKQKQENVKLEQKTIAFRQAARDILGTSCSGSVVHEKVATKMDEKHLKMFNRQLGDDLDRIRAIKSVKPSDSSSRTSWLEVALVAMMELINMVQVAEPLWEQFGEYGREKLDYECYLKHYARCFGRKNDEYMSEATRESGVAMIHSLALVKSLMDGNEWAEMFPGVIASSATTEVISSGMDRTPNGALQLMQAAFQVVSPMVPLRHVNFLRFCKQIASDAWAVVDVSVEAGGDLLRCRRLPSGCVVQDMPNGHSKVTWVEHAEYNASVISPSYQHILRSGLGLGALRWLAALQRHCECLTLTTSVRDPTIRSEFWRMLKLTARMTDSFCASVCGSDSRDWRLLRAEGVRKDVRLMTQQQIRNPGEPVALVMSASTSFWLPAAPRCLFDRLLNKHRRSKWDFLSNWTSMEENVCIPKGSDPGNAVTLLTARKWGEQESSHLILQESSTDLATSMVVCTPLDAAQMDRFTAGGDAANVSLLPYGFAIVPDGKSTQGSLVTVGLQYVVESLPSGDPTKESVETMTEVVLCIFQNLKTVMGLS